MVFRYAAFKVCTSNAPLPSVIWKLEKRRFFSTLIYNITEKMGLHFLSRNAVGCEVLSKLKQSNVCCYKNLVLLCSIIEWVMQSNKLNDVLPCLSPNYFHRVGYSSSFCHSYCQTLTHFQSSLSNTIYATFISILSRFHITFKWKETNLILASIENQINRITLKSDQIFMNRNFWWVGFPSWICENLCDLVEMKMKKSINLDMMAFQTKHFFFNNQIKFLYVLLSVRWQRCCCTQFLNTKVCWIRV